MRTLRIGAGAGYSGERIEPAIELAEKGELDYLFFECLGERTVALAQLEKMHDSARGFDTLLEMRMKAVLPACRRSGTKVITNMGAANPRAAAAKTIQIAEALGLKGLIVATVEGDDVVDAIRSGNFVTADSGLVLASLPGTLVSANAYLGAEPIVEALRGGADVVITGRVADPSLILAPLMFEFGWAPDDWVKLGKGTLVGHLLECCPQITGGYFADPGFKDVHDLARIGFPIAEVQENGDATITKVAGSGGEVSVRTCKEQLLYELHDPARYITPDVVADFSLVKLSLVGKDRVQVEGASGAPRTDTLKVSAGFIDGFIGEGQLTYAGPGAKRRGQLALDIVAERLRITHLKARELRFEMIGFNSAHGPLAPSSFEPYEVRIRVAGRTDLKVDAERIGNEVEALFTAGPAGGGGAFRTTRPVLELASVLLPRAQIKTAIKIQEAR